MHWYLCNIILKVSKEAWVLLECTYDYIFPANSVFWVFFFFSFHVLFLKAYVGLGFQGSLTFTASLYLEVVINVVKPFRIPWRKRTKIFSQIYSKRSWTTRLICRTLDLGIQRHNLSLDLAAKEGKWGIGKYSRMYRKVAFLFIY